MSSLIQLDTDIENLEPICLQLPDSFVGKRVDVALANLIPELSRSRLSAWLKAGNVLIDGKVLRAKDIVLGGETVTITPIPDESMQTYVAEDIELNIIYEDEQVIVINKPAGLVVHPGNGNWSGTLLNGLLFHYPELKNIPRAGIVHRLDKDTSGLMVVARTLTAQTRLVQNLQDRIVTRIYRAIVEGHLHKDGVVNKNIGRDPNNRIRMATVDFGGKEAITKYRVIEQFEKFSYIECKLETGRTHQIRVHLKSIGHPLVGDPIYGHRKINYHANIVDAIESLNRQALHAILLSFTHPTTLETMKFKIPLPYDMKFLLNELREGTGFHHDDMNDDDMSDNGWEVIYVRE